MYLCELPFPALTVSLSCRRISEALEGRSDVEYGRKERNVITPRNS